MSPDEPRPPLGRAKEESGAKSCQSCKRIQPVSPLGRASSKRPKGNKKSKRSRLVGPIEGGQWDCPGNEVRSRREQSAA